MSRCPNGTRRNKKTGNCEPKGTNHRCPRGTCRNKKTGNCVQSKISDAELTKIFNSMVLRPEERKELEQMRPIFRNMRYKKSYKSCFTGESTRDIYDMISTKISCWVKYDDDI